jgi:hypothetical protein
LLPPSEAPRRTGPYHAGETTASAGSRSARPFGVSQQLARLDKGGDADATPAAAVRAESLRQTLDRLQTASFALVLDAQTLGLDAAAATGRVTVWVPAEAPTAPYAPSVALTTAVGVVAGFLAANEGEGGHFDRPHPQSSVLG